MIEQAAEAFERTYPDLMARNSATSDQIRRMITYVAHVP
jgi:hypothetical protein